MKAPFPFAAASFAVARLLCEKRPGGETAPIPFSPDSEIPLSQKSVELEGFIANEMSRDGIPGLAIALVRDGKVTWTRGSGVANAVTRRPVLSDTSFEGASLGKCLTTYAALTLVQEDRLDLHRPLSNYLEASFVSDPERGARISAWHVMTHTSGLSNDLMEKTHSVSFDPGSRFSYSGVGFMYLQKAMEAITREPFDDFMRRTIFDSLGMQSTSFFRAFGKSSMARGHGYVFGFAVPWPYGSIEQPNAANLLCTTAPDLAKFLAELMNPTIVDKQLVDQMLSPQQTLGGKVSWGLGVALHETTKGRCFWHWGDNLDFESYLVGCREQQMGIVVMTNSSRGRLITREVAARALGKVTSN